MVVALGSFIAFLNATLPYKNQNTLCIVKSLMTAALFSNFIGLLVAILDNPDDYNLATLWFTGVPLVGIVAYSCWQFRLHSVIRKKFEIAKKTSALVLGNDIQGASGGTFMHLLEMLAEPNPIEKVDLSGAFLNAMQMSQISAAMACNMSNTYKHVDFSRNRIQGLSHGVDLLIAKSDTIKILILDHNDL